MKETRIKKIFDRINDTNQYVTSEELANEFQVSTKTIRNEIKEINRIFDNHGAQIISKSGLGYLFEIEDLLAFREFLATKWHSYAFEEQLFSSRKYRVDQLLKILLYEKGYVKTEDLCDVVQVSKSQLTNDLKVFREKIEEYNLTLESKPYYGLKIIGPEMNFRLCIAACLFSSDKDEAYSSDDLPKNLVNNDDDRDYIIIIKKLILSAFEKYDYETSKLIFRNLVTHLFIALKRIHMGDHIRIDEETLLQMKNDEEYEIAHEIVKSMEKEFEITIPDDEIGYVSMHLLGKRSYMDANKNLNYITAEVNELVTEMLKRVKRDVEIDLTKDLDLRIALGMHIVPLIQRIRFNLDLKNPLLEDIKTHKKTFIIALVAVSVLEEKFSTKLSDDEVAYFALHFYVALEKAQSMVKKKKVLLVCATGHGTAKFLKYRFKEEFGSYIEELESIDAFTIKTQNLEKYDLIVSVVPIDVVTATPIIQIASFLDDKDIHIIKQGLIETGSTITKHFDPRLFYSNLEADTKEEAIQIMCNGLTDIYNLEMGMYESVLEREAAAPTEFGNDIALPHPMTSFSKNTMVAVAVLKKPIIWTNKSVQLIFLLSYGQGESEELEDFFEKSAQFLINHEDIKKVISTRDYNTFISLIEKN